MSHFIENYLDNYYPVVEPKQFYKEIFATKPLAVKGELAQGTYNGVALELFPTEKVIVEDKEELKTHTKRHIITNELDKLDYLLKTDNFVIVSPISYIGKSRKSENSRFIYAIVIDLDGVETEGHLNDLFYQIENEILPRPTYTVFSGNGIHLYYHLETALPCYEHITKQLNKLKKGLTKKIWNKYTTTEYEKTQFQGVFQGFRLVGGITKNGDRTKAYKTGYSVSINYLNEFVGDKEQVKNLIANRISLAEAKEKYPEWYEKRIIEGQPKGTWQCKRDVYEWWLNRLKKEVVEGHRYYAVMCLSVYAKKCGISREELEEDAFGLVEHMEKLTTKEDNHFTRLDVLSALEAYNDKYITFPIDTIATLTNIKIEKNKRNGRKRAEHIKLMNFIREEINGNKDWRYKGGSKPRKKNIVEEWQVKNPNGTKAQCIRETGVSRPTVMKYWKEG